tara:strand:+ start:1226 stop:1972 length:747 start_codon:yes stop_codon:yes gene_type:complete
MITINYLDIRKYKPRDSGRSTRYFIDASYQTTDWVDNHRLKNEKTLDNLLDIVDEQKIVAEQGGIAAYIRTKPLADHRNPLKRAVAALGPKATVQNKFCVDFEGDSYVREIPTLKGTVYEIFINTDPKTTKTEDKINPEPIKKKKTNGNPKQQWMIENRFLNSLAELYEQLGLTGGNLVLHSQYQDPTRQDPDRIFYHCKPMLKDTKLEKGFVTTQTLVPGEIDIDPKVARLERQLEREIKNKRETKK